MPVDLENYVPNLLGPEVSDKVGQEITSDYWNLLFKKIWTQGDYNAETLQALITKLNTTLYNKDDGGLFINKKALDDGDEQSGTTVSEQIDYIFERLLPLYVIGKANGAEYLLNENFETPDDCDEPLETVAQQIKYLYDGLRVLYDTFPAEHADLPGRSEPGAHPMSAITGLNEYLNQLQLGLAEAYPHNLFPGRDADGAHSIKAITGLTEALNKLSKHTTENDSPVHPARVIKGQDSTGSWQNLQDLLNNIYALLRAATGFAQLNHNDLLGREIANSHSIQAVKGLSDSLSDRYTKKEADTRFQTKIIYGTEAPTGSYPDGTIYLRIR